MEHGFLFTTPGTILLVLSSLAYIRCWICSLATHMADWLIVSDWANRPRKVLHRRHRLALGRLVPVLRQRDYLLPRLQAR